MKNTEKVKSLSNIGSPGIPVPEAGTLHMVPSVVPRDLTSHLKTDFLLPVGCMPRDDKGHLKQSLCKLLQWLSVNSGFLKWKHVAVKSDTQEVFVPER